MNECKRNLPSNMALHLALAAWIILIRRPIAASPILRRSPNAIYWLAFYRHREEGLEALVAFADADKTIIDDCDVFFDELSINGDCGYFYFENPY